MLTVTEDVHEATRRRRVPAERVPRRYAERRPVCAGPSRGDDTHEMRKQWS
jgi:hypothetical protein